MNKKHIVNAGLVITTALAAFAIAGYYLNKDYQNNVQNLTITNVNPNTVQDGVYRGFAELTYVGVQTEVVVSNGVILDVTLLQHRQKRGEPAEVLIDQVVEGQTLELDIVSGATASSKLILKSIENALNEGVISAE